MLRLMVQALGVPLDGKEEGKGGVFEGFDDAIGRDGDDAEAAADAGDGLLVVGVGDKTRAADGAGEEGVGGQLDGVLRKVAVEAAVLDGIIARNVRKELMQRAAAIDVDQL